MANLYRKSVMDKLSSPEKLDQSIIIISPSFWIAAIGGLVIIVVALVWSIFGRLPVNVQANGMFMGNSNIQNVIAEADGVVDKVFVRDGEEVSRGQEIAKLDDKVYTDAINELLGRKEAVEAVTFWSEGDPATADTKALIDIKSQADIADTNLTADEIALRERYRSLSKQESRTAEAKKERNSAKNNYDKLSKKLAEYHYQDKYDAATEAYQKAVNDVAEYQKKYPSPDPEQEKELERLKKIAEDRLKDREDLETDYQMLQVDVKNAESALSIAQQNYTSEAASQKQLEDSVSQYEAKVSGDSSGESRQMSSLRKQFEAAKGSTIDQIDQEIKKQRKSAESMHLKSRINGRVSGLNIKTGNAVQTGSSICKVVSTSGEDNEIICYVPVGDGRKIKKDMKATVYLSTVNRQEYGHMKGTVTGVSDNVVSAEEMMNELGDQSLVQSFQQTGPVVLVKIKLDADPETVSGYLWSSKKGADLEVAEGTVVQADIVVDEKAPITMLIPYLKEKLSVHRADGNNANQTDQQ